MICLIINELLYKELMNHDKLKGKQSMARAVTSQITHAFCYMCVGYYSQESGVKENRVILEWCPESHMMEIISTSSQCKACAQHLSQGLAQGL